MRRLPRSEFMTRAKWFARSVLVRSGTSAEIWQHTVSSARLTVVANSFAIAIQVAQTKARLSPHL